MRIYFKTLALPKKAAKRIQRHFTSEYLKEVHPESCMKLHEAQEIAASMLGYSDWHELTEATKHPSHPPSLLDEDSTELEQRARIDYQASVLRLVSPMTASARRQIALKLRVSSGSLNSATLRENIHYRNSIFYSQEDQTHKFIPSIRSENDIFEIREIDRPVEESGLAVAFELNAYQNIIDRHPESMAAVSAWICWVADCGGTQDWDQHDPALLAHEFQIINSIPEVLLKSGDIQMSWDLFENRDFIRAVYWLARAFYGAGNLSKALKWFTFSSSLCDHFSTKTEKYLEDLSLNTPTGTVVVYASERY